MFAFIKGKLFQASPSKAIIDCQGVGYEILIPPSVYSQLPAQGKEILLYTYFVVREQSQALYGFFSMDERECFEQLLDINGVGPKTALSIIGHLPLVKLREAIQKNDVMMLCKVPGVGKKTAQRLMLDMRDKVSMKGGVLPSDWQVEIASDPRSDKIRDAMSALINLGYNQTTAEKALKQSLQGLPESIDLAGLITAALKNV